MIKIRVDEKTIETEAGEPLLQVCLDHGIYIPHLCWLKGMTDPLASCRLCFVEIEGEKKPVASCTVPVTEGLTVRTDTPAVRQLQRTALALLLSVHEVDCKHCHANRKCELQRLARFLKVGLKPKGLQHYRRPVPVSEDHPLLIYYPNRCVLCGRCVYICRTCQDHPLISFVRRGFETGIGFHGIRELPELPCTSCRACLAVCPVGALAPKA